MTMHRPHPDPRTDEVEAVLYDDCERCAQHARHPLGSLDRDHLERLAGMADLTSWTNDTEKKACENLALGLFDLEDALRQIGELRRLF